MPEFVKGIVTHDYSPEGDAEFGQVRGELLRSYLNYDNGTTYHADC